MNQPSIIDPNRLLAAAHKSTRVQCNPYPKLTTCHEKEAYLSFKNTLAAEDFH